MMKYVLALTAAIFAVPAGAHEIHGQTHSTSGTYATQYDGYTTQYRIISIKPLPHPAGYQELNLSPAPKTYVAPGPHTGEAIVIYPQGYLPSH